MVALGLHRCSQAFSSCNEWGLHFVMVHGLLSLWSSDSRAQPQKLWHTGIVALRHVESSQSRDRTCVPHIDRQILGHWTTREFCITVSIVDTYRVPMIHISNASDTLEKEMATHSICLENSRDGGVWWAAIYGVANSQTGLSNWAHSTYSVSYGYQINTHTFNVLSGSAMSHSLCPHRL